MQKDKDKARQVFEKVRNTKQPMNLWEHIRNHQFKAEQQKKLEEEVEQTHNAPDFARDHIQWLK